MKQTYTSAGTSGNFGTPALFNNKMAVLLMTGKTVLDIGCGKFKSAEKRCLEYASEYVGYDKYNLPFYFLPQANCTYHILHIQKRIQDNVFPLT